VDLAEVPVGAPALDAQGGVLVADQKGGLTRIPADAARPDWRFQPPGAREATSGPVVARNGNIYYTAIDRVQAVSPAGEALWRAGNFSNYLYNIPRLSPLESFVFLQDQAFGASLGALQDTSGLYQTADPLLLYSAPEFFVGPNRSTYLRVGHGAYLWRTSETGMQVERVISLALVLRSTYPFDAGAAPNGDIWLLYTSDYTTAELYWLNGLSGAETGAYKTNTYRTRLIATDPGQRAYLCGDTGLRVECTAVSSAGTPLWTLLVGNGDRVLGGALLPGRLVVASASGLLAALGDMP
jgi:outer membrane protein assembly factor BamB